MSDQGHKKPARRRVLILIWLREQEFAFSAHAAESILTPLPMLRIGAPAMLLRIMHDNPAHPWTLDKLATESGASRASLARRFHDLVGEPPMTFLKNWRMAMAADLLCQPDETVGTVAEKVGYATPFAFSAAFKRVRGLSPQEHRRSALS